MFCKNCGSHLADDALFCPNCGTKTNDTPSGQTPPPNGQTGYTPNGYNTGNGYNNPNGYNNANYNSATPTNTLAIVGFVLSFFVALAGLICSILGYNKAKNENLGYGGLALAGIIISVLSMILSVILYVFVLSELATATYYVLLPLV